MKYNRLKPRGLSGSDTEAMAERVRLTGELLQALVHAFANDRKVQQKFRYAVVSRLARIEATVGAIHGLQIVLSRKQGDPAFKDKIEEDAKAAEEFIARNEMEHGLRMIRYIYGPDAEATPRHDIRRRWSGWEI